MSAVTYFWGIFSVLCCSGGLVTPQTKLCFACPVSSRCSQHQFHRSPSSSRDLSQPSQCLKDGAAGSARVSRRVHPPQICWESCPAGALPRQLAALDVCDSCIYYCCFCGFRSVRASYLHEHPAYHWSLETGINYDKILKCCFKSFLTTVKKIFRCCWRLSQSCSSQPYVIGIFVSSLPLHYLPCFFLECKA